MLDAPVSGGEIGAINASLSIMVGGDATTFAQAKPILDAMGNPERVIRIGESGAGQICKVCNQMVIGGALAAVSEAFALARKAGVEPASVREALLGGFASSRVLEVHGERMLQGNYKPGFRAQLYAEGHAHRRPDARRSRDACPGLERGAAARDVNGCRGARGRGLFGARDGRLPPGWPDRSRLLDHLVTGRDVEEILGQRVRRYIGDAW